MLNLNFAFIFDSIRSYAFGPETLLPWRSATSPSGEESLDIETYCILYTRALQFFTLILALSHLSLAAAR